MLYILICRDKPEVGLQRRMAARPDHLSYLESAGDKVRIGGAMLTQDGESPIGSVIILEADTIEDARAFALSDPYTKAEVFSEVEIYPWKQAAGVVKAG